VGTDVGLTVGVIEGVTLGTGAGLPFMYDGEIVGESLGK